MSTKHDTNLGPNHLIGGTLGAFLQRSAINTVANLGENPVLIRVIVEEILFDPTMIDDDKYSYIDSLLDEKNSANVRDAPANSIIGRPVRDGTDSGVSKSQIFYPFLPPHLMMPLKPGEHVWVFFEQNKDYQFGYWMWRIAEPRQVDDLNYTHHDRQFDATSFKTSGGKFVEGSGGPTTSPQLNNGPVRNFAGQPQNDASGASYVGDEKAYETLLKDSDAGKISDFEDVPRWKKRPGDFVIQGSNNTLISLGTDRVGSVAETTKDPKKGTVVKGKPSSDKKKKAGAIDMVVGRGQGSKTKNKTVDNKVFTETDKTTGSKENLSEGDPDFDADLARVYLSMKTDVDKNFSVQLRTVDPETGDASAGVVKADHVRIIARKTLKLMVQPKFDSSADECAGIMIDEIGNIILIPSAKGVIMMGGKDADKAVLGTTAGVAGQAAGKVTATPIISTFIATVGGPEGNVGNGEYATKLMAK